MNQSYSNFRATMAIAKASLRSIMRSPSAVVFSLAFPLIFIVVFANIESGGVNVDVGVAKTCDTLNPIYQTLKKTSVIHLVTDESTADMQKNLSKGTIDVIIDIKKNYNIGMAPAAGSDSTAKAPFTLNTTYTASSPQKGGIFKSLMQSIFFEMNKRYTERMHLPAPPALAEMKETTITGREYHYIDFILPGMLGFSLLSAGVFGTAFVFLSLRITLVIKRFFATPVKRYSIVLGEALARLTFSLAGALFLILVGHYAFHFTLVHGVTTVLNMLLLAAIGLIIFMGFGFIISGIAKNESSIPPISNIITMPQFLLSGTFFAVTAFPAWLQVISKILPLTYLNNAMRAVAFEGAGLGDVSHELLILLAWFVGIYLVAIKTFKWE